MRYLPQTASDTIAPIVGPEDPRRFTDSGIEVESLYDEDDLPAPLDLGEGGLAVDCAAAAPSPAPAPTAARWSGWRC